MKSDTSVIVRHDQQNPQAFEQVLVQFRKVSAGAVEEAIKRQRRGSKKSKTEAAMKRARKFN
jgi:hypothetical protein